MTDTQSNHFMVYVTWENILNWKKDEIEKNKLIKKKHVKPYAHGTSSKIAAKVKKGDIVWVIIIPRYGKYSSLPSLNAKIVVADIVNMETATEERKMDRIPSYIRTYRNPTTDERWKYAIIGEKCKSIYFPINNIYDVLMDTIPKEKAFQLRKQIASGGFGWIGRFLHRPPIRKLDKNTRDAMLKHSRTIKKSDTLFISYKRGIEEKTVITIVEILLKQKINCWVDINRMPQDLSEKDKKKAETYFNLELKNAIKESRGFLAFISKEYIKSEWTTMEYNFAKKKCRCWGFLFKPVSLNKVKDKKYQQNLINDILKHIKKL